MWILDDLALLESEDLDAVASAFLAVMPADRVDRVKAALAVLLPAYKAKTIFNSDYETHRLTLSRAFEKALDVAFDGLSYGDRSALGYGLGLHSVPSLLKKLSKAKGFEAPPEVLERIKKFLNACLPVSNIITALKKMTVKGKKPPTPEQAAKKAAQLANKTVKTCACCFRPIGVLPNGLIADHGYTMPFQFGKTASCPGRQFPPLEVSSDGLVYMIKKYKERMSQLETAIHQAPKLDVLYKPTFSKKKMQGDPVKPGEPEWDALLKQKLDDLQRELQYAKEQLKKFETTLAHWKPEVVESLRDLIDGLSILL